MFDEIPDPPIAAASNRIPANGPVIINLHHHLLSTNLFQRTPRTSSLVPPKAGSSNPLYPLPLLPPPPGAALRIQPASLLLRRCPSSLRPPAEQAPTRVQPPRRSCHRLGHQLICCQHVCGHAHTHRHNNINWRGAWPNEWWQRHTLTITNKSGGGWCVVCQQCGSSRSSSGDGNCGSDWCFLCSCHGGL